VLATFCPVPNILVGKPEGKSPVGRSRCRWEDSIIIDLRQTEQNLWTRLICLRIRTSDRPCEHGNEPWGFIKRGEFLDWLSDYQLLKDFAP
jgi:hypothetical protein